MSQFKKKLAITTITLCSLALTVGIAVAIYAKVNEMSKAPEPPSTVYVRTLSAEEYGKLYGQEGGVVHTPHGSYKFSAGEFDKSKYSHSEIANSIEETTEKTKVIVEKDGGIFIKE
ncbi:hypothetical protein ACVNS2_12215 [Paenibacillus caseinilyticus]|uniref:Uncharacterized protein n=1 Tax=Paenibacillus mucilaginosus K02 TaxID=997761 RepID=I0BG99_9BACL|nr:hypothetical protein [Paenibacillus mucilaginosus]AFH61396.1 hypothetical protein B2K_11800 [Paenibacillus mucilaginosus K02]